MQKTDHKDQLRALAVELFGCSDRAERWLQTPRAFLPGQPPISPLAMAETAAGAKNAAERLHRVAYGNF